MEGNHPTEDAAVAPRFRPTEVLLLALALVMGLSLASTKSLVLDEFHSEYHAGREGLPLLLEGLRQDNHPPLSFLLQRLAGTLLGTSDLALRLPALLASLLELALVATLARSVRGARPLTAMSFLAVSSLHLDEGTQVRMYAPLACAITLASLGALRRARGQGGAWSLGIGAWAAMHLHYHAIYSLLALVLGTWWILRRDLASTWRALAPPLGAAALATLPWVWLGLRAQLGHALPPGGDDLGWTSLPEGLLHLFAINVRFGGPIGRLLFIACAGAVLLLALQGARGPRTAGAEPEGPSARPLLIAVGFGAPALAFAAAQCWDRAGFTWHYLLPSAAPLAILAAAGSSSSRAAQLLSVPVRIGLLGLCLLHLARPATEDFRGAVEHVLAQARPGDAVLCVEYQPPVFPTGRPWERYARDAEVPERLLTQGIHLVDRASLEGRERVWLVASSLGGDTDLRQQLRADFECVESRSFGFKPSVELWQRR